MTFDSSGDSAVHIALEASEATVKPLFKAIAKRQCTRAEYYDKLLSTEDLKLLETAGTGDGIRVVMLAD